MLWPFQLLFPESTAAVEYTPDFGFCLAVFAEYISISTLLTQCQKSTCQLGLYNAFHGFQSSKCAFWFEQ